VRPLQCRVDVVLEDGADRAGVEYAAAPQDRPLRITDSVAPRVLLSYEGLWMKTMGSDQTVSALAPAT